MAEEYTYPPMCYDKDGNPRFKSIMTPSTDTRRAKCAVPPTKIIPVILVPGFMGSNLRVIKGVNPIIKAETIFWQPDNLGVLNELTKLDGSKRQQVFDPANTQVASSGPNSLGNALFTPFQADDRYNSTILTDEVRTNWKGEYARRGWDTVHQDSYIRLLAHLEYHLNRFYRGKEHALRWRELLRYQGGKDWGTLKGFAELNTGHLDKAAKFWYPVHAAGYNWLQSTRQSGLDLAARIKAIIGHYAQIGYACRQAILVTHSQGALVARAACHPQIGAAQNQVLGIVQGEAPLLGAPAVYKRMRAGHESLPGAISWLVGNTQAEILGKSAAEMTPVLANSPGALELLPTQFYVPGWLRIDAMGGQPAQQFPKINPYREIYAERTAWWRLVKEELLDQGGATSQQQSTGSGGSPSWNHYMRQLDSAEKLHRAVDLYHHPRSVHRRGVSAGEGVSVGGCGYYDGVRRLSGRAHRF